MSYPSALDDPDAQNMVLRPQLREMLSAILSEHKDAVDIVFSPGRPPQIESGGQLAPVSIPGLSRLTAEDTARIVANILGENHYAQEKLRSEGSHDVSCSVPSVSRFRANIFSQRGSYAVVMRMIPHIVPDLKTLNLPEHVAEITGLLSGMVLVTGPTGSGKSSVLAAVLNKINKEKAYHIVTIEDPIEFIHPHKRSTVHQRELYSDAPSFSVALRAAMRQASNVIMVGEMRDKETIDLALEAAETGHLILSALHANDAVKAVERIVGVFPPEEQQLVRNRLARSFRYIISRRLIPAKHGAGRVAAVEILKSTSRTRDHIEKGDKEGKGLVDAMRKSHSEGMQDFDSEIEKLIRSGQVDLETGLAYCSNIADLKLNLSDIRTLS